MQRLLIDLHYFPCIAWFSLLARAEVLVIEKCEHFKKQTYRNRCLIRGANKIETLIVPITDKHGKTPVTGVTIDYRQKWMNNHWRTLMSAYRNAPYFEHYADELKDLLYSGTQHLFQLNYSLLEAVMRWVQHIPPVEFTAAYEKSPGDGIIDMRDKVHPKKPELLRAFHQPVPYTQVFGNQFEGNLSILDLLFCEGPGTLHHLRASGHTIKPE